MIALLHQSDMSPPKFLAGWLVASLWSLESVCGLVNFWMILGSGTQCRLTKTPLRYFMFMYFNLIYHVLVWWFRILLFLFDDLVYHCSCCILWWVVLEQAGGLHGVIRWFKLILGVFDCWVGLIWLFCFSDSTYQLFCYFSKIGNKKFEKIRHG